MLKKLFILFVLFTPFAGYSMELSFDKAVGMILEQSHDIKKADANVKKASAGLKSANANRWFKLEATATYMNTINVEDPSEPIIIAMPGGLGGLPIPPVNFEVPDNILMAGVTLSQPIYTFGKIGHAVDSVRSAVKMAENGKELAKREVRYSAAQLYWTAKMTDEIVNIAQKSLDESKAARKKLTSAGRPARANLVKIEADIATKEINLSDAKFNRDTAERMLKIMAGIDIDSELDLVTEIPESFGPQAAQMNSNPEWEILEAQAKMHESDAKSKRAGNYPTLAAMASYNYIATHTDYDVWRGNNSQSAYWGLSLTLPIFNGGLNRANATAAAMDAEAVRQDLDKSKKIKSEEFETAVKKYEHLRANLGSLEQARNLAQKAYGYSMDRFAAGQTSAIELSDVSASLAQMDMALLNARYNILMAWETVRKLGDTNSQ